MRSPHSWRAMKQSSRSNRWLQKVGKLQAGVPFFILQRRLAVFGCAVLCGAGRRHLAGDAVKGIGRPSRSVSNGAGQSRAAENTRGTFAIKEGPTPASEVRFDVPRGEVRIAGLDGVHGS